MDEDGGWWSWLESYRIYKTVDGGKTWTLINPPSDIEPIELGGMSWLSRTARGAIRKSINDGITFKN